MHTDPNAGLKPLSRERLLRRHIDHGAPFAELAAQAGISLRTAYTWPARYRSSGAPALADRRSVRRTQRRTLGPQQLQHAVNFRHERCTIRRIAKVVGSPLSTVARAMKALGLGRLRNLEPRRMRFSVAVTSGTAVPAGEAGRRDPCRHQTAGPVRTGRPPHHRPSSPRLFEVCWLREGACRHRRRHAPSLCRGASGRAEGNDCRLPGSGCRIVQPAGHHLPARSLGQRVCLSIRSVAQGLQDPRSHSVPHKAVHTP